MGSGNIDDVRVFSWGQRHGGGTYLDERSGTVPWRTPLGLEFIGFRILLCTSSQEAQHQDV